MTYPLFIGIAGPSGSGKTSLTENLQTSLGDARCSVLSLDQYYKDMSHKSDSEIAAYNFDHPDAWDQALLLEHCLDLKAEKAVAQPRYDFARHARKKETVLVEPKAILLAEGLFALALPSLRELFDFSVYLDCDEAICLQRRIQRDVGERGRSEASVREQFERFTRPSMRECIVPSAAWAELRIDGTQSLDVSTSQALKTIEERLKTN